MPVRVKEVLKHKIKIKRNDQVLVIAGKDKGKKGRVLRVLAEKNRVLVEGVMLMKKHMKPNPQKNIKGGIAEQEPGRVPAWTARRRFESRSRTIARSLRRRASVKF
jgi:hypothetical protein